VKSLLVVTVVGAFTGMVLALQTGAELRDYGAEHQLPKIVAGTMAREMGPFITSIILAATAGAAIAAELGTMKVSEEIDALELMNVDPVAFLVSPRVLSMGLSCFLLTVWVDFVGVCGGAVVAHAQHGTLYRDFLHGARETLASSEIFGGLSKGLFSGLVKAWFFGILIGGLACATGLKARGGALGVGRAVRAAVTASVVLTLIVGYILTWVFWA
jgi:phospholipid/cholesterol/gamma-HCH transport system permease protein